ncbi:MAG: hypothetical protein ACRED2_01670 [Methylocella sp.]
MPRNAGPRKAPGTLGRSNEVRMVWLRRAIGVIFATAAAIGAGLVFVPVAALADPVTRAAGFALIQFAVWTLADAESAGGLGCGCLPELTRFVWLAVMTVCVVPVVAVVSIGEVARVRALSWYAGATGFAAASAPWLIRTTLHLPRAAGYNVAELRFALVFFFAGLISGSVYWLLAGRDAGASL